MLLVKVTGGRFLVEGCWFIVVGNAMAFSWGLTRSRRENPAFNYGFFRPNPLVFLRTAGENAGHASHSTDFGVAEQTEIVGSARKSSAHAPGVTDS